MGCSKRQIGQWMFQVNHVAELERQADWLLSCFEKMHNGGTIFSPGMKVELGWSMLELRNDGVDTLVVCEPDFSKNPLNDVRADVSVTLQVQASQVAFVNQCKLAPLAVSFQDRIVFAKGCMEAKNIYLERVTPRPDKGDSGWFVGFVEGNNEPENLQAGFVYQLLNLRPMLLQVLLLPAGYMVVLNGDKIEAILDQKGVSIQSS